MKHMKSILAVVGAVSGIVLGLGGCAPKAQGGDLGPGMKTQRAFAEQNLAGPRLKDGAMILAPSVYTSDDIIRVANELERGMRQDGVLQAIGETARLDTPLLEDLGGGTSRRSHRIRGSLDGRVDFVIYPREPISDLAKKVYEESNQTLGTANFQWVSESDQSDEALDPIVAKVVKAFGSPAAREDATEFSVFSLSTETVGESGVVAKGVVLEYGERKAFQSLRVEIGKTPAKNGSAIVLQMSVEYGGWPLLQVP